MLLSMTGFGEAHRQKDGVAVAMEVRAINSRYFKFSMRYTDGYSAIEPKIEAIVRDQIQRGTVQVYLRVDRAPEPGDFQIDGRVLERYREQINEISSQWGDPQPLDTQSFLSLPGVIRESPTRRDTDRDWPLIEATLSDALTKLAKMRSAEGAAMKADLLTHCGLIADRIGQIETLAPKVAVGYQERLSERVSKSLERLNVTVEPADLVREVSLFSERSDISEELVRMKSHLEQFQAAMESGESCGRTLDFLTQEMSREANTIGSKAGDVDIARHVIDIKAAVERMREQVQNVQ